MKFVTRCTLTGLGTVAIFAACAAAATPVRAEYPERNITVIVPFPAGGASDITARLITGKLAERVKQTVVVDNRAGANGAVGSVALKQAAPDGYTLLIGSIGVFAINPALFKELRYDPQKDFDLLSLAVRTPNVLVANPAYPASSVRELIEQLKSTPGKITFASSGTGSSDHLTAALFWQKTGTTGIHVPYRGGGPAINDLIAGHANVSFQNLGAIAEQREGRTAEGAGRHQQRARRHAAECSHHGRSGRDGSRGLFLASCRCAQGPAGRGQSQARSGACGFGAIARRQGEVRGHRLRCDRQQWQPVRGIRGR